MKVGDMVKWHWHLGEATWETTEFQGIIVDLKLGTGAEAKVTIFDVFANDGTVITVRDDAPGMELVT